MSLQNELTNDPRALIANFDICAMSLINGMQNLMAQTIRGMQADDPTIALDALENVQSSMQFLREIRDALAAREGIVMSSEDSMAFVRQTLVDSLGEAKVAEAERTGKVPASVVADAMLDDLFNS